jgi:thiol:disulfide interchange protein DsbC
LSQSIRSLAGMKSLFTLGRAIAAVALLIYAFTANAVAPATDTDTVRRNLKERYPQLEVKDIRSSPLPGWYEVFTGTQLAYSDATADHLFVGKLIDTRTKEDLAARELQARLAIDFQQLPFDRAIKIIKGDGSRRLALFEDPDCPFCQQLEHQLAQVDNVTVYVFLFPLVELHPQARVHAHAIWCAQDRGDAWTHWMLDRKDPGSAQCKSDPIDQLQTAGIALNVTGTPTWFTSSGKRFEGVLSAAQLEQVLSPPKGDAAAASAGPSAPTAASSSGS